MRLAGKIALITGAVKGQGRAAAKLFAEEGATVVINDIAENEVGEELVEKIRQSGGRARYICADVSDPSEVKRMMETIDKTFNGLHILYNNAGILLGNDVPVVELEEEIWDRTIDVNLKGIYLCCKWGIPLLMKAGGGSIINVSSVAGYGGDEVVHAYAASKGGVISLTKSIALKYGPCGIRANVICPGFVKTPMTQRFINDPYFNKKWISRTPLGRVGEPEEIAYVSLFLASEESSFVTGSIYTVHGGLVK